MTLLQRTCAAVLPVCRDAARRAQARLDRKTKPRGSLGRLEDLACRLAAAYGTADPPLPVKAVLVLAADHGVAGVVNLFGMESPGLTASLAIAAHVAAIAQFLS